MKFKDMTSDLKSKIINCKTAEELLEIAKEEGYELSDEELSQISGGSLWSCDEYTCSTFNPNCTKLYNRGR